jgi:hypothetical protein
MLFGDHRHQKPPSPNKLFYSFQLSILAELVAGVKQYVGDFSVAPLRASDSIIVLSS